ncbi:MAG: hypothetical protein KIT16_07395 [Rhodospirillaceae bacterium]|nr:hypothetical protein [Rhodospirillaceae bacterium]
MRFLGLALMIVPLAAGAARAEDTLGRCFERGGEPATETFAVGTVDRQILAKAEARGARCRVTVNGKVRWLDWLGVAAAPAQERSPIWDFSDFPAPPPLHTLTDPDAAATLLERFYAAQGGWSVSVSDTVRGVVIRDREWRVFRVAPWASPEQFVAVRHTHRFGFLARLYEGHRHWSGPVALDFDAAAAAEAKQTAEQKEH